MEGINYRNIERKTLRLVIRPIKQEDYIFFLNSVKNYKKKHKFDTYNEVIKSTLKEDFIKFVKNSFSLMKIDHTYGFCVFLKSGELIGRISIMDISRGLFQNAYIGYTFHNEYWYKGYGTEALKVLIDIAFKELKLHRLEAGIEEDNKASIALAKKTGFELEGISKKRLYIREKWRDIHNYAQINPDDFSPL